MLHVDSWMISSVEVISVLVVKIILVKIDERGIGFERNINVPFISKISLCRISFKKFISVDINGRSLSTYRLDLSLFNSQSGV